jgi:hypothetical protein
MNLEENSINWQGQIKPTSDPKHFLAQFATIEYGLRAGVKDLVNQQRIHGRRTWRTIIEEYAPSNENDTSEYIKWMCDGTGVGPDDEFDLTQSSFLSLSVSRVIRMEQGYDACTPDAINLAVNDVLSVAA